MYNPTPRALRNEMDVVSLSLHGYGPADLPQRNHMNHSRRIGPSPIDGKYRFQFEIEAPKDPRPGHVNAPLIPINC